ncbi:hypothetical protein DDE05_17035 [Streptomyces cavourensis]|nr:hypothetical protein DDE05_17035 [Streptomyces cavourensis]
MNRIYRLVWNAVTQCWSAVSENAKAQGKSSRPGVLSCAILGAVVTTGGALFSSAVQAQALQIYNSGFDVGRVYAHDGAGAIGGAGSSFSLQNLGSGPGGGGHNASTVFIRGREDLTLLLGGLSGIVMLNPVNLSGNKIRNLAAGDVTAASTEAVNGSQLFVTNTNLATAQTSINQNTTAITNLSGRMTTTEGNVTNLGGRITQTNTNLTNLQTQINNGTTGWCARTRRAAT